MPRLVRFEIHATEPQRLIDFYGAVFGWKFTEMSPIQWWRIDTGDLAGAAVHGGLVRRPCPPPGDSSAINAFICTIDVESVDATLAQCLRLGAVLAMPKFAVPKVGWLAYIRDPDGNALALMQMDATAA